MVNVTWEQLFFSDFYGSFETFLIINAKKCNIAKSY